MKVSVHQLIWVTIGAISLTIFTGFGHLFARHHQAVASNRPITKVSHSATKVTTPVPETVDWHKPSLSRPYPKLAKYDDINIQVSIRKQRVYLKNHDQTLYTMLASTGKHGSDTPKDTLKSKLNEDNTFLTRNRVKAPITGSHSRIMGFTYFTQSQLMLTINTSLKKPSNLVKSPIHMVVFA